MRAQWLAASLALWLGAAQLPMMGQAWAQAQDAYIDMPLYYPVLDANEMPVQASFVPAGGPLQRYAGRPNAWYAVMQLPMIPGQTYLLLVSTPGEAERLRVASFDEDPFGNPNTHTEIQTQPVGPRTLHSVTLAATVRIAADAAVPGVYLLIEWQPDYGPPVPPPVRVQAMSLYVAPPVIGRNNRWPSPPAPGRSENVRSPLSTPQGSFVVLGGLATSATMASGLVQELAVPRHRPGPRQ